MPEKSLNFESAPMVLPSLVLMTINVVVLELGRKGLWDDSGVGFSPWYPVAFAMVHLFFWPVKIFVDRLYSWWCTFMEVVLMIAFLFYNYTSFKMIMYVS